MEGGVTIDEVYGYNNPNFSFQPKFNGVPLSTGIRVYGSFFNIPGSNVEFSNSQMIPLNGIYASQAITLVPTGDDTEKILITEAGRYFVVFSTNCVKKGIQPSTINLLQNGIPRAEYSVSQQIYIYANMGGDIRTDPCDFTKTLSFFADYSQNDLLSFVVSGGSVELQANKGPQISITLMKIADPV